MAKILIWDIETIVTIGTIKIIRIIAEKIALRLSLDIFWLF